MSNQVVVHKDRTNTIIVKLGIDVSGDIFTSEIRTQPTVESTLIATWDVSFVSDGSDGLLTLVLDDDITSKIEPTSGYMDLKRLSGGEPIPVFDKPLEVLFIGSVTA